MNASSTISPSEARSVQGPTRGISTTVPAAGSDVRVIDCREVAGKAVRISAGAEPLLYVFVAHNPLGDGDPTLYTALLITADSPTFTDGVPEIIWAATSDRVVVPVEKPILITLSETATASSIRVRRA